MIDWPELSKLIISFFSGGLLTYLAHRLSIRREREKSKREILVLCDLKIGDHLYPNIGNPEDFHDIIVISVVNVSQRPITITDAGLHLNDGRNFRITKSILGEWKIPKKLEDGDAVNYQMRFVDVFTALNKDKVIFDYAWACDATQTIYKGVLSKRLNQKIKESFGVK
jgi:hypothetical protein